MLGPSIDALMSIDYPAGAWRLYVVDDASTDHTPEVMHAKWRSIPVRSFICDAKKVARERHTR